MAARRGWLDILLPAPPLVRKASQGKTALPCVPGARIVDLVMTRGHLAAGECAKELRVDVATSRRHLRKLVDSGILESRGSGPRLAYYLAGSE
jgi:Fic family protein